MAYGILKCDTITFTDGGVDKSVSISGLVQNPTFSGSITVVNAISGNTIQGQAVSSVTVTGTTAAFTTGTFISLTGTTTEGTTATYTTGSFTSLTGTTTTGTTATFASGVFTTQISGATITGNAAAFTTVTGGTATITSGVFASGSAAAPSVSVGTTDNGLYSPGTDQVAISTNGTGRLFVAADGKVGIGTDNPVTKLQVGTGNPTADTTIARFGTADANVYALALTNWTGASTSYGPKIVFDNSTRSTWVIGGEDGGGSFIFKDVTTGNDERMRIDSSGRLLVGTSSTSDSAKFLMQGNAVDATGGSIINLCNGKATLVDGESTGIIRFSDNTHAEAAIIQSARDGGTWSGTSKPSRLTFSTTPDGSAAPVERMRIPSDGSVLIGKTSSDDTVQGASYTGGRWNVTTLTAAPLLLNRQNDDGDVVIIRQANTTEGSISVSGTTVSYNGAHLSRWSQLPSGAERIEILRGSVLSNIDEMCEWSEEDNEQLNRMKVSDVEGDKNVSGVFQAWDDDDDTYTNDFYCAMTGDFIIRIAQDITVERGDLLMSAGDGTAKPQDDDIIRSKTIAKVTSTNVSCTYPDGSYCVPCVLMAC